MTNKPLPSFDSGSIVRYLYALISIILLLLIIASLFILWRHHQVTQYHHKLSQYHQETTINLDSLISELNFLATLVTQPSAVEVGIKQNIDFSGHLFVIEDKIKKILLVEQQYNTNEFKTTIERLQKYHITLQNIHKNQIQGMQLTNSWHSTVKPLLKTAEQLRRFHLRDSSRLGSALTLSQQRNLWFGLAILAILVAIGITITIQVVRKIRRLIGLQLASEGQFKSMIESAPDAIIIANKKDHIFLVNEHTEQIFGYNRHELIGASTNLLIPQSLQTQRGSFYSYLNSTRSLSNINKLELIGKRKNGATFPAEVSLSELQSNDIPLIVGSIRDISDRKRIEQAMEYLARYGSVTSSEEDFFSNCVLSLALAYHAKYAFIGLLENNRDIYVQSIAACRNNEIIENFQYNLKHTPCEKVVNEGKQIIQHGAMKIYPKDELLKKMGIDAYFSAPLIKSNGSKFGLVVIGHPAPLIHDHWTELLLDIYAVRIANELERRNIEKELCNQHEHLEELVHERTRELENSNKELRSAIKELESFSYTVSHDLRSPLRALDGYSSILMEDYGTQLDDTSREYLNRIRSASHRMGDIIDGLLGLTRIKIQTLQPETVDLSKIVREIAQSLSDNDPERHVQWVIEDGLICEADAGLIQIMLQNLLENAWKYTAQRANAKIIFGLKQDYEKPTYYIADNGIGFDMQYANKLFSSFSRLHADENDFTGMGIGLATVYRIIERHNGKIWAKATVNEGACFYFTLEQ